jgi:hypothetical protein
MCYYHILSVTNVYYVILCVTMLCVTNVLLMCHIVLLMCYYVLLMCYYV